MQFEFRKATKEKQKARIALMGPAGSGKTFTALKLAKALGKRILVIDTERGSASKYAGDVASFDTTDLPDHKPSTYRACLEAAGEHGFDVVIIDSLSHAWCGTDGALALVDKASKRMKGNSFAAWKDVRPELNKLRDAILEYPAHVIATMRTKTEWLQEKDDRGRTKITRVGLAPVYESGSEYEFDIVGELDLDGNMSVTKSRCSELQNAVIHRPDEKVGEAILDWLSDGAEPIDRKQVAFDRCVAGIEAATNSAELQNAREAALMESRSRKFTGDQNDALKAAMSAAKQRINGSEEEA